MSARFQQLRIWRIGMFWRALKVSPPFVLTRSLAQPDSNRSQDFTPGYADLPANALQTGTMASNSSTDSGLVVGDTYSRPELGEDGNEYSTLSVSSGGTDYNSRTMQP